VQIDYLAKAGTAFSVDESSFFVHKFGDDLLDYHEVVKFMYPMREDLRWDGE
jgi:hypothetical protein